jgi:hypothetical protein
MHVFEALRRKVAIVEECARNPKQISHHPKLPQNRKELREWADASRGLWSWEWVRLDHPEHPKNGQLVNAFLVAAESIKEASFAQHAPQQELRLRDDIIKRQELRISELLSEVIELRRKVHRA